MNAPVLESFMAAVQPQPAGAAAADGSDLPDVVGGASPLLQAANAVINLIPQIRAMATVGDPRRFQQYLLEGVQAFERQARARGVPGDTIMGARYCLCTVLDEAAAQTPWGGSGVWPAYSLLVSLHNETWGGEKFFQLLNKLAQTPQQHIDLIELMYFCLLLGFEGRYRVIENGYSQLATLKAHLLQLIEHTRGERSAALSVHWQGVERRAAPPWAVIPLWVGALVALLVGFGVYLGFSFRLATPADSLWADISHTRVSKSKAAPIEAARPRLRQFLEVEIREGLVEVSDALDRSTIVLRGDGLFEPASTSVKPAYVDVIARVGQALGQVPGQVVVRGYTDNTPIRTLRFPSNWELSQDRARAVADMLARSLSDPSRVQAQGRADTEPVAPNNSAEGRARNRRVEIILMVAPQARDAALQTPEARPAAADPTGNK